MAHHKSAIKRIRQTEKRTEYNRKFKKAMKEAIKAVRLATSHADAVEKLSVANKILDKNVHRGIVKRNTAANRMSSLHLHVNKLVKVA